MKKVILPFLLFFGYATASLQCNVMNKPCHKVRCTMMFVGITLKVSSASPLGEIEVIVKDATTNTVVNTSKKTVSGTSDVFTIMDDGDFKFLEPVHKAKPFIVEVWQNSVLKQTLNYEFGRDCCHVFKKSGPNSIKL